MVECIDLSQATANHGKIGDGFHKAIEGISTELEYCASTLLKLQGSSEASKIERKRIIAHFFLQIFNFLIPYAKWCKSGFHRFRQSVNKTYYEDYVSGPLDDILRQTKRLERNTKYDIRVS